MQTRKPSDLRVCYLCGDNPINDLEVFVENGVLCQNVWAIEKVGSVLEEAWKNVAKSNMRNIRLFKGDLLTYLKDLEGHHLLRCVWNFAITKTKHAQNHRLHFPLQQACISRSSDYQFLFPARNETS